MVMLPFAAVRRQSSTTGCQTQLPSFCSPTAEKADQASVWDRSRIVYDVETEAVGVGAFGSVHRARLVSDGRRCVVKEVLKRSVEAEAAARQEAEVLGRLNHSSICQFFGAFEDDRAIYLVLEYIDGRDLLDELAETGGAPMDEVRAANIARQVFDALYYLHDSGCSLLHRDLKLENVMLSRSALSEEGVSTDDVKLIDFGLAVTCKDSIRTSIVGTPGYIAPESMEKGAYSRASDMWSAGVMLHMLLTGGLLPVMYRSEDGQVSLDATSMEQVGVSMAAIELVQGLLEARPQERLTAAEAAVHPWIACDGCYQPNPRPCPMPVTPLRTTEWIQCMQRPTLSGTKACSKPTCLLSLEATAWEVDIHEDTCLAIPTPSRSNATRIRGHRRQCRQRCGLRRGNCNRNRQCHENQKFVSSTPLENKEN